MSNIEKIRQKIDRQKKICEGIFERESDTYYQGKAVAYGELLAFIDSLPDESKVDVTDFCKPIDPGIAQCIADNWWEMLGEEEKSSEDLEIAAEEYAPDFSNSIISKAAVDAVRDAFKAGAEWMAKQGFISEGIIYQTPGEDTKIELNEHIGYLEDCEKVIVNIRKK